MVQDDVWVKYLDRRGILMVGFGQTPERIGPELEFGQVLGDHFGERVLIIKACCGGHRLRNEFRSPRMGLAPEAVLAEIPGDLRRQDTQAVIDDARARCGALYRDMVAEVRRTLADLGDHIPGNQGQGHELAGFVWFFRSVGAFHRRPSERLERAGWTTTPRLGTIGAGSRDLIVAEF